MSVKLSSKNYYASVEDLIESNFINCKVKGIGKARNEADIKIERCIQQKFSEVESILKSPRLFAQQVFITLDENAKEKSIEDLSLRDFKIMSKKPSGWFEKILDFFGLNFFKRTRQSTMEKLDKVLVLRIGDAIQPKRTLFSEHIETTHERFARIQETSKVIQEIFNRDKLFFKDPVQLRIIQS